MLDNKKIVRDLRAKAEGQDFTMRFLMRSAADALENLLKDIAAREDIIDRQACFNNRLVGELLSKDDVVGRLTDHLVAARGERDIVTQRMIQLEQEKAALLADLKKADLDCVFCQNCGKVPEDCAGECLGCTKDCPCRDCRDANKWEWRGIVEGK